MPHGHGKEGSQCNHAKICLRAMYGYGRRIENEIIVHMAPRVDWLYGECMTEEKIKSVTPGAVLQVFFLRRACQCSLQTCYSP